MMQIVLIGNAVIHESVEIALKQHWNVLKFPNLQLFISKIHMIHGPYALWIHFDTKIADSSFEGIPKPQFLMTTTTGVTHISEAVYEEYSNSGNFISLMGEVDFLKEITSTAEHAWGIMLMLTSRVQRAISDFDSGSYQRVFDYKLKQLSEMSMGIIGCGRLGSMTYRYAKAFGLKVKIFDVDSHKYSTGLVDYSDIATSLDSLCAESEIIMLHASSHARAEAILDESRMSLLPSGSFIVNTSRANLINGQSLISKLRDKSLSGYAADVHYGEDLEGDSEIDLELNALKNGDRNVIMTPHIGGGTTSAIVKCENFLLGKLMLLNSRNLRE